MINNKLWPAGKYVLLEPYKETGDIEREADLIYLPKDPDKEEERYQTFVIDSSGDKCDNVVSGDNGKIAIIDVSGLEQMTIFGETIHFCLEGSVVAMFDHDAAEEE
jgi:hypothetical protein